MKIWKKLNHVHPFVAAFIGKIKKNQFRRRSNSPNKKTIMHEIWTRKIWNSLVFILLFEVLSGLQLDSDSQYFLKFDTHTFSNILHICNHGFSPLSQYDAIWRGVDIKVRGGESIWCLFADYHCHLILTHEMKKLPQLKYWTTRKMSFQRIYTSIWISWRALRTLSLTISYLGMWVCG